MSKDSILRLDCDTKSIMESFPLSGVHRWVFDDKIFSVDFGDFHKNFSVQTTEGQKIADIVARYVSIIDKG